MKKTKNVLAIALLFSGYALASDGQQIDDLQVVASASVDGNGQSTSDQAAAQDDQDNFEDTREEEQPEVLRDGAQAAQPGIEVAAVPAVPGLGQIAQLAAAARGRGVRTGELAGAILRDLTGGRQPNEGSRAGEGPAVDFAAEIRARHANLNQTGLLFRK